MRQIVNQIDLLEIEINAVERQIEVAFFRVTVKELTFARSILLGRMKKLRDEDSMTPDDNTTLTEAQFVSHVWSRLETPPDPMDRECVSRLIKQHYRAGWPLSDTVCVMRLTEHIDPDLPEEVALRRMKKYTDKHADKSKC